MRRTAVLATHPGEYAIRGGANPHTRSEGGLKRVEPRVAWRQWNNYVDALEEGGVDVYVAEPGDGLTGMVFAANAGFVPERLDDVPVGAKTFYPSHFAAEHRVPESAQFADFMEKFGFRVADYDSALTFEGEADAFPVGRGDETRWLVTYGFRSDPGLPDWVRDRVDEPVESFELADPAYYHGDCVACDLGGPVLAWPEGLVESERFRRVFEDRLVELDDEEAANFVANAFYVEAEDERLLYTPAEIGGAMRARLEERGLRVVPVEVSEFFGKGGGGPKCLVFNLGRVDPDAPASDAETAAFRRRRRLENLRRRNELPDPTRLRS